MKIAFFLQARCGSKRLPGKMILPFYDNKSLPLLIANNLKYYFPNTSIYFLTTDSSSDDNFASDLERNGYITFRGDVNNVLHRFYSSSKIYNVDWIIRICCDNPFINPELIKDFFNYVDYDYVSYMLPNNVPAIKTSLGFFAEGISSKSLHDLVKVDLDHTETEHVTPFYYTRNHNYKVRYLSYRLPGNRDYKSYRFTVDTIEDFRTTQLLYKKLYAKGSESDLDKLFNITDNLGLCKLMKFNNNLKQNEK